MTKLLNVTLVLAGALVACRGTKTSPLSPSPIAPPPAGRGGT